MSLTPSDRAEGAAPAFGLGLPGTDHVGRLPCGARKVVAGVRGMSPGQRARCTLAITGATSGDGRAAPNSNAARRTGDIDAARRLVEFSR